MKIGFKKEHLLVVTVVAGIFISFISSGCAGIGGGGEENKTGTVVGQYGIQITKWDTAGDTFLSGTESVPFILDGRDVKDGTPSRNVFARILGSGTSIAPKFIGKVRDGGTLGRPQFTASAPTVRTETTYQPSARVCYVYTTHASQEFWVVKSGDYPGLEMPDLGTSHNKAPVKIEVNPSSAYYEGGIRPIQVAGTEPTENSVGVGIVNRDSGFIANNTGNSTSYGEQSRLTKFTLEVPSWGGNNTVADSGDKLTCETYSTEGKTWIQCNATNIRMVDIEGQSSATLAPSFKFQLPKGLKEREGRIWTEATYRYCITTSDISITIKPEA